MIYGIWGDTNGDDDAQAMVGEASISLATACYGKSQINGNSGHDANDVLYLAFVGKDAVPGTGADWGAANYTAFIRSIASLGDQLVERVGGPSGNYPGNDNGGDDGHDDDSAAATARGGWAMVVTLAMAVGLGVAVL